MGYDESTRASVVAKDPEARAVVDRYLPGALDAPVLQHLRFVTLGMVAGRTPMTESEPRLAPMWAELAQLDGVAPAPAPDLEPVTPDPDYESTSVARGSATLRPVAPAESWGVAELVLDGPDHGNPFVDVELTATFTHDAAEPVAVGGFYDGAGVYRIRFQPQAEGEWSFETASTARSLDGLRGSIQVAPPSAGNHGPVDVADRFHFAHRDGTRHLPIGTTVYALTHQPDEVEERTLATLATAGFRKIRICVFPKSYLFNDNEPSRYPFRALPEGGWDTTRFEPEFFRHLEHRIEQLAQLGIETDLILFHAYDRWGFSELGRAADDRYVRYLVRRLAAHRSVWWSVANEYDLVLSKTTDDWERIGALIGEEDHVGHLTSIHNCFGFYDHSRPWITHVSAQRQDLYRTAENTDAWRQEYGKPVVIDECAYEGDIDQGWGNISGQELVRRFWEGAVRGGYVGHGETYLNDREELWWSKGGDLVGESPERIRFLLDVLDAVPGGVLDPTPGEFDLPWAAGGEVRIGYFGFGRPRYRDLVLPPGSDWRVEVLDTWNCTIEALPGAFRGRFRVPLPGREYMALRLTELNTAGDTVDATARPNSDDELTMPGQEQYMAAWDGAEARARVRLAQLSQEDRIAIALAEFDRVSDPSVVPFLYSDGPNGVRAAPGATAFPSALALAASFDRELAAAFGRTVAGELLAAGKNALLGPAFDVARVPHSGRAGENLGEDPMLAGEIGGTVVQHLQAEGVLAVVKHYVANNFEWLRTGSGFPQRADAMDVHIGPRTLTDVYLEPFRVALGRYGAAALMGSYNRLNGEYVCQSADLLSLPRERWGWKGVTIPDFLFAVRDPAAALAAGLDLPGLDGAAGRTADHLLADPARLDQVVLHILTAAEFVGLRAPRPDPAKLGTPDAVRLAERIATEGMVLLRNEGPVLPLAAGTRVALIGQEVAAELLVIGGSAAVIAPADRVVSPATALAERLPVSTAPGADGVTALPPLESERTERGVRATVRESGTATERELRLDRFLLEAPADIGGGWSATVETRLVPTRSGRHVLSLEFAGQATLLVDGREAAAGFREASPFVAGPLLPLFAVVDLEAGKPVEVRVEYTTGVAISIPIPGAPIRPHLALGWNEPDDRLTTAAALAARADVAIVLAGRVSSEGMDVDDLGLPGSQDDLIEAVAAANPRTVVVTLGAGPVLLPWLERVSAVLHAWFPGEGFAAALAAVLTGEAEPGGRLVVTWPTGEGIGPLESERQYPGVDGAAEYSEGALVGYRWYAARGVEPAYPFGHGLGYTTTEIGAPDVAVTADAVTVTVEARDAGSRAGKAVLQAYVTHPAQAGRPPAQLRAFQAVRLEPGESRTVRLDIAIEDLSCADEAGDRQPVPGHYIVAIGRSSTDVASRAGFDLA